MTLAELRTAMVAAKTGNDIVDVLFDWATLNNETVSKTYPYVFWLIDIAEGTKKSLDNEIEGELETSVFCVKKYTPDTDRLPEYDSLFADLDAYLTKLNTAQFISVQERDIDWEILPEGFISVDRELAVRYTITLTLWC